MKLQFSTTEPCLILMADDDANDAFLFGRGLSRSETPHSLMHVKDGLDAMKYLRGEHPYTDRGQFPEPHLMILDLKMPFMNGFDVLLAVRADEKLSRLPIVVMSGSDIEPDRTRAIELGARAFFVKPVGGAEMVQCAEAICNQWMPNGCNGETAPATQAA